MNQSLASKIKSILCILFLTGLLSAGSIVRAPKLELWTPYTIGEGESLWSIAANHCRGGKDTREILERIKDYNHIENKTIYPGDQVYIPLDFIN